ncbi:MAG TPA: VOC family protein [Candidatus Acidoferrum sp.]|nr:VOC family protein [Candidatus Acidoferrum sp.]
MIKKLTPVLFVEKIEPVLPFWTEQLGFTKTVEVPDGDRLAFVILQQGTAEVMYQTYASVEKDMPAIVPDVRKGPTFLYIEVENLDALKPALNAADVYLPERTTFYGAREIGVKDSAGHFLTFAQMSAATGQSA